MYIMSESNIVSVILVVDTGIMSTDDSVCLSNFSFFALSLLSFIRATHIKIYRERLSVASFFNGRGVGGLRGIQGVSRLYQQIVSVPIRNAFTISNRF